MPTFLALFVTCLAVDGAGAQYFPALKPTHANVVCGEAGGQNRVLDTCHLAFLKAELMGSAEQGAGN